MAGFPLHHFSEGGNWVRSFGSKDPTLRPDLRHLLYRQVRIASDNTLWVAPINEYGFEQWTLGGRPLQFVVAERQWFEPWVRAISHQRSAPPTPMLQDLFTDSRGRLWSISTVPATAWASALSDSLDSMGNNLQRPGAIYRNAVIEVIDVARGILLAKYRAPVPWTGFAGDGIVWRTWVDAKGNPRTEIAQITLGGP